MKLFRFGQSRFQMLEVDPAVIAVSVFRIVKALQRQMADRPIENFAVAASPGGSTAENHRSVRASVEAIVGRQRMGNQMPYGWVRPGG